MDIVTLISVLITVLGSQFFTNWLNKKGLSKELDVKIQQLSIENERATTERKAEQIDLVTKYYKQVQAVLDNQNSNFGKNHEEQHLKLKVEIVKDIKEYVLKQINDLIENRNKAEIKLAALILMQASDFKNNKKAVDELLKKEHLNGEIEKIYNLKYRANNKLKIKQLKEKKCS